MTSYPSTFEAEVKALREQNTELALQVLASDGQAAEAHEARLIAEDQAKALRARVANLTQTIEHMGAAVERMERAEARVVELEKQLKELEARK